MKNYLQAFVTLLFPLLVGCNSAATQTEELNQILTAPATNSLSEAQSRAPLMVSRDFGLSWQAVTSNLPADLQVSFIESMGDELVLASDNKGLFLSQENKTEWISISRDLPNPKINALHVEDDNIYAGVYRAGIFVSRDMGASWQSLNYNLPNLSVQAILHYDQQLIVGTDAGIFTLQESADGWQASSIKAQVLSLYEYENKIVAGSSTGTIISEDKGQNWEWIHQEGAVHYTHNLGKRIVELALMGDLNYSDDWGASWQKMQYQPRAGSYVYEIIEAGNYQLISNNYGIHRSSDGGSNWELIFKTESMALFDFILIGDVIYGGTRAWDEYRKRN